MTFQLYWTRERVLEGLRKAAAEIEGKLPVSDREYRPLKAYKDWPPLKRIYEYFGSVCRAWYEAGIDPSRYTLRHTEWTGDDAEHLLTYAGEKTLPEIARELHRTTGAVRRHLHEVGITARSNQGYLSAGEVAREFRCSYNRVRRMLNEGSLPGHFDKVRKRWEVEITDITPEMKALLQAPRRTHKTHPLDMGDYYQRYRIRRIKGVRVEDYGMERSTDGDTADIPILQGAGRVADEEQLVHSVAR